MIHFLDTSALVKLFIAEPGSETLRQRISDQQIAVSQLTYAETHATFARRRREDLLTPDELRLLIESFEHDWRTVLQVPISEQVLAIVPELCQAHPLRGADALQLAAALMVDRQGVKVQFVANDQRLLAAAKAEGLTTFDPAQ